MIDQPVWKTFKKRESQGGEQTNISEQFRRLDIDPREAMKLVETESLFWA